MKPEVAVHSRDGNVLSFVTHDPRRYTISTSTWN